MNHIFTIGHSLHTGSDFLSLIKQHKITAIGDVRSVPASARAPQFNQSIISKWLKEANIAYVHLGDQLGGKPNEPAFYDNEGHALYNLMAKTEHFQKGIGRVISGSRKFNLALMCSEGEPCTCHRHNLIAPVLHSMGVKITHIKRDGTVVAYSDIVHEDLIPRTLGKSPKPIRKNI